MIFYRGDSFSKASAKSTDSAIIDLLLVGSLNFMGNREGAGWSIVK
jgi:hypothetical protein